MEDDKKTSMSDKDRRMAGRFEGFGLKKEDDEEKKKGKKTTKVPKRSIFLGKDSEISLNPDKKDKTLEKKGLFSGLLKDKEVEVESVPLKPEKLDVELDNKDKFQEVVYDRIQDLEEELELPLHQTQAEAVTADVEFLEDVSERIEEGLSPVEAIDDALEDTYTPPEADALEPDLEIVDNFEPVPDATIIEEELAPETAPIIVNPFLNNLSAPNLQPASPNVTPTPNVVPMNEVYYRDRGTGEVLLGGALGYLIDKRRGRHVAEGRLEPQLEKKDAEIKEFKTKLQESERQVREATINKTAEAVETSTAKQPERISIDKAEQEISSLVQETTDAEKQAVEQQEKQFEDSIIISTEEATSTIEAPDKQAENKDEISEKHRDVRSLTVPELLEIAEHIGFEKSNLRELYERHRIDAVNLRRVIIEYMNGGNRYEKVLNRSLEAVEMQRELRNEIKQDDPVFTALSTDDDGRISGDNHSESVGNNFRGIDDKLDSSIPESINEIVEHSPVLSGSSAVALGVLIGIAFVIMMLVFG